MELKPFIYSEFINGKKVQTRNGISVEKMYMFSEKISRPLAAVVEGVIKCYRPDGRHLEECPSPLDLFIVPEKREVWVCYWKKDGYEEFNASESKEKAELESIAAKGIIVTTVKIWEEEI